MADESFKPWQTQAGDRAAPRNAAAAAKVRDWPAYFARVEGKHPRETLTAALDAFAAEGVPDAAKQESNDAAPAPLAIDLGCGSGRDTLEMLGRGWRVVAIDGHREALARLLYQPGLGPTSRLTIRLETFERLGRLPRCRLVNASFSLPFCPPRHFPEVWSAVRGAIEPGGRFSGQLFGDRDSWAIIEDRSHFTRPEAEALLDGLEVERFDEEEREGPDASDHHKHWHVFHVIARRP